MRPSFHPRLVNSRFGDPGLFVERLHRRDALLFDLGDLSALSTRDLLRVGHVFVTHTHIDHFIGFDALLRVLVGRERTITMVGPPGFATRVEHKLLGYQWDLVDRYATDLVFDVTELDSDLRTRRVRFRLKRGFAREELGEGVAEEGVVAQGDGFEVRAAVLVHHGPSIGYAATEPAHFNVWRNRLEERGLAPGPWLQALKRAVAEGADDDHRLVTPAGEIPLGDLREMLTVTAGQKFAYVTDVADTPDNRDRIARRADGADTLFIESCFAARDKAQAQARAHLTTHAAGEIAHAARARRVEPFHFSPRYEQDGEEAMIAEVLSAFRHAEDQARAGSRSGSEATSS